MKFAKTVLAAALVAATPFAAQAQMRALSDPVVPQPDPESLFTSSDPVLHRNKQAALHIQRNLLKCNEWGRAGEWLTDAYIQHNPVAASGLEGVLYYFTQIARRPVLDPCPALSAEDSNGVVAVQAEGDYVTILTRRIMPYADDPTQSYTTTWFDTWRFVDGKADEHWDPATLPTAMPSQALDINKTLQEAHDRALIEDLMWRYVRAIDSWNADAYAAVFTEDGSFGATQGRNNLRQMVTDLAGNRSDQSRQLFHVMSNQNISFLSPSVAVVSYYWQTVSGGSPGGPAPQLLAQGRGRDVVVKQENGSWLIRSRDVAPQGD
jgi:uncharacterized protein (TIGR02246 family)